MDTPGPYLLLSTLSEEVRSSLVLHPQITTLNQLFLKYLKEPRYQSPLTIVELSHLFQYFYRDLKSLVINIFTQSNSTKKQLISVSNYFNSNPKKFDYLLAIANYSPSSIKLLKRSDPDAILQLRIFNYYKFLIIFESLELAQLNLFNSINNDDIKLYDKIFKFDQKDIIYQEFLTEKLTLLKSLNLSFSYFIESNSNNKDNQKLIKFINSINKVDIILIQKIFNDLNCKNLTPYSKLSNIVLIHKLLIKNFIKSGQFKNNEINNDVLLPTLIYLIIYKLNTQDLYLNFLFIKNFLNLLDPYRVEIFPLNLYASSNYNPTVDKASNKYYKTGDLFEFLNISTDGNNNETTNNQDDQNDIQQQQQQQIQEGGLSTDEFFTNDKDMINYLSETYINNGELSYYLTNFEAIIVFLSNITVNELLSHNSSSSPEEVEKLISEASSNKLLTSPISKLVDEELLSHFQFPDGKLNEEISGSQADLNAINQDPSQEQLSTQSSQSQVHTETQPQPQTQNRSRSSSILNTISNRINETRTRSNSSIMNTLKQSNSALSKESFPTLMDSNSNDSSSIQTDSLDLNNGFNMMKNILGRFSSSVGNSQPSDFFSPLPSQPQQMDEMVNSGLESSSPQRRSASLINKLSPHHSRTRSSSLETALNGNNTTFVNGIHYKRNSITAKLSNGVTEFMTKLNNQPALPNSASTIVLPSQAQDQQEPPTPSSTTSHHQSNGSNGSTDTINKNISNISLHSLDNEHIDSNGANIFSTTPSKKGGESRSRGTSLQIMDKFFSNISQQSQKFMMPASTSSSLDQHISNHSRSQLHLQSQHSDLNLSNNQLFKFHQMDFDSLTIKDLKELKSSYDQLCTQYLLLSSSSTGTITSLENNAGSGIVPEGSISISNVSAPASAGVTASSTSASIAEEDEHEDQIDSERKSGIEVLDDANEEGEGLEVGEQVGEHQEEEEDDDDEEEEDSTSNGDSGSDEVASGDTIATDSLAQVAKIVDLPVLDAIAASATIDSV
ncbi:hypothetical protein DFJ63DRAFT_320737 [Scheffersomyces coipomensis]|uniref:uncharacterized protein n=1 Tax=Scheffersomyces coipomensis TaxID=1788519 RepID=UPI00315CEDBA